MNNSKYFMMVMTPSKKKLGVDVPACFMGKKIGFPRSKDFEIDYRELIRADNIEDVGTFFKFDPIRVYATLPTVDQFIKWCHDNDIEPVSTMICSDTNIIEVGYDIGIMYFKKYITCIGDEVVEVEPSRELEDCYSMRCNYTEEYHKRNVVNIAEELTESDVWSIIARNIRVGFNRAVIYDNRLIAFYSSNRYERSGERLDNVGYKAKHDYHNIVIPTPELSITKIIKKDEVIEYMTKHFIGITSDYDASIGYPRLHKKSVKFMGMEDVVFFFDSDQFREDRMTPEEINLVNTSWRKLEEFRSKCAKYCTAKNAEQLKALSVRNILGYANF